MIFREHGMEQWVGWLVACKMTPPSLSSCNFRIEQPRYGATTYGATTYGGATTAYAGSTTPTA